MAAIMTVQTNTKPPNPMAIPSAIRRLAIHAIAEAIKREPPSNNFRRAGIVTWRVTLSKRVYSQTDGSIPVLEPSMICTMTKAMLP